MHPIICNPAASPSSRRPALLCRSVPVLLLGGLLAFGSSSAASEDPPTEPAAGETWVQAVPGTAVDLVMKPVPGDGETLWVMQDELTWNLFDIFIFRLDEKKGKSSPASDAVTRPTKPYIAVDRGFGHDGYPAISMSFKGALQFAEWVSAKTGRDFRVPTVEQWSRICAGAKIPADELADYAWYEANSGETTHPVGSRKADHLGLHDLYGNVGEWCHAGGTAEKPVGVLMGGGYESSATQLDCVHTVPYDPMWNDSDPQFPKSIWWLADAAYVGLRLVCIEDGGNATPTKASQKTELAPQENDHDES